MQFPQSSEPNDGGITLLSPTPAPVAATAPQGVEQEIAAALAFKAAAQPMAVSPAATDSTEAPQAPAPAESLLSGISAALDGAPTASIPAMASVDSGVADAADVASPAINKTKVIVKALRSMEQNIANIIRLLESEGPTDATVSAALDAQQSSRELEFASVRPVEGTVIEGVFDGRQMVGSDGKVYAVPPNYASKSKLVEGDMLKLTITPRGSFIYKQIGPIERGRVVASLGFDQTTGEFYAAETDKRWSILKASVTFFKGEQDDEVVLLVPKNAPSKWAAVENIIKKNPLV